MDRSELPFQWERTGENVVTVRHENVCAGWEQWYLLTADHHWDNPLSDWKMMRRHYQEAVDRKAGILAIGDLFCLMQGKYDPRADKSALRPEHKTKDYFDAVRTSAIDFFAPYKDHWIMAGRGNHDEEARRRHEFDLMGLFGQALGIEIMGVAGYVMFRFAQAGNRGGRTTRVLYFHHGAGGGGEVTRGTIKTNRRAVYVPDAHIVVSGHIHEQFLMLIPRLRITDLGRIYYDYQYHVQIPTYKQEHTLEGGFHVERERQPKPIGAWWLRFFHKPDAPGNVGIDFSLAQ